MGHEGVACLVIGGDRLLLGTKHVAGSLRPEGDALGRRHGIGHGDEVGSPAGGEQRPLVQEVGEVRPGEARGLPGDGGKIDVRCQRLAPSVDV